jgi:DNA invertase Pin-like site-specific DNA recombinase
MRAKHTPPIPRRKAFSYVRFSTAEQSKGDSRRRQEQTAIDYAERHNLDLDETLRFEDLGVSAYRGKNAVEGELRTFIDAVKQGIVPQGSVLLVESLDRISRLAPLDAVNLLDEITRTGVGVATLSDGKVYERDSLRQSTLDLMTAIMVAARSNEESQRKSERLRKVWAEKNNRAKGEVITRTCVAWVNPNKEKVGPRERPSGFVLIPERAKIVKWIYAQTLKGVGVNKLAEMLNKKGVETWGKGKKKADFWRASYIQKILANPAVIGDLHAHMREEEPGTRTMRRRPTGDVIKAYYPRVISPSDFAKVQRQRSNNAGRNRAKGGTISNLLAGIGRCHKCGGTMTNSNKGGNNRRRLVCARAKQKAGCVCTPVSADKVDAAIVLNVLRLTQEIPAAAPDTERRVAALREELSAAEGSVESLRITLNDHPELGVSLWRELGIQEAKHKALLAQYREASAERRDSGFLIVKGRVNDLLKAMGLDPAAPEKNAETLEKIAEGRDHWGRIRLPESMDRGEINAALARLFESVKVDYRRKVLVFRWQGGGQSVISYDPDKQPLNRYAVLPSEPRDFEAEEDAQIDEHESTLIKAAREMRRA